MRERGDGHRPALDGSLAHLLDHHQRLHVLICRPASAKVLLLGLGVAIAANCDGESDAAL